MPPLISFKAGLRALMDGATALRALRTLWEGLVIIAERRSRVWPETFERVLFRVRNDPRKVLITGVTSSGTKAIAMN